MTDGPPTGRRYLLLDDARSLGGGQGFALRLARHLAAAHPDVGVRIACPAPSQLAQACDEHRIARVDQRFPPPRPASAAALVAAALPLRRLVARMPAGEVVIANTARAQALVALATVGRRRPPIVNLMHERDSAARPTARWVHRRVGALVAVGANSVRTYSQGLPGAVVLPTNNFLLPDEFDRFAACRHAVSAPGVVGVLARLIPEKGVLELVEELAAFPEAWRELRVAGAFQDRAYVERLRARVAELGLDGRVRLLGEQLDVPAFLAEVDSLAVPSTGREGQPTVVLEALGAGVPVVVRGTVLSEDFAGLPVRPYTDSVELARALTDPSPEAVPVAELAGRFGPEQAVAAIEAAAGHAMRHNVLGS